MGARPRCDDRARFGGRRSLVLLALALFQLAGWSRTARAESKLVQSYEAPAECPTAAWFEGELRKRTPAGVELEGAVRLRIERRGSMYAGRVQRIQLESDLGTREVEHPSCDQVVDALALISALALAPDPPKKEPPSAAERKQGAAVGSQRGRLNAADSERARAQAPPVRREPTANPTRRASARALRTRHAAAVGLAAQAFVGPRLRFGPRVQYRFLLDWGRHETELGIAFTRIQSGTIEVQGVGSAELGYSAGRARACEAFRFARAGLLAPCAFLDVGELRGRGRVASSAASDQSRSALWLSPGLLGKLEWRPWSLLALEISAGAFFPLSRPEFFFTVAGAQPSQRVIRSTPEKLGFSAGLLVDLHFP